MHKHTSHCALDFPANARKIVLAGNPNVGKSVFFNALTGIYVDVSNYPGTTLDISHGRYGEDVVIDTPGVYGVSSFNDEERVARDVILTADVVINVADAAHLERDLFLTQQIIDMGIPLVLVLNMMDEAEAQGLQIDVPRLSELLGVPVVPAVAIRKDGIEELKAALPQARKGKIDPELEEKLKPLLEKVDTQAEALMILEEDQFVAACHGIKIEEKSREEIYLKRRERVDCILAQVIKETNKGASFSTKLSRAMINPLTGIPILILLLWGMYQLIGVFVAGTVVGFTEETIMQGIYEPAVHGFISRFISEESILGRFLIGEFGLLTMTVTYILGLLLPLVVGFYFILSIMEDSGYLPRLATLADRVLTFFGLNGRAIIPIILGFGCVTMATITTRMLGSDRERKIAIFLLGLTIPCSAQLGVIAGLLAGLDAGLVALYLLVIVGVFALAGTALNKLLPGKSTDLLIEIPPLRLPRWDNVLKKTVTKSAAFIKEATPLFALGALLITTMQLTGFLELAQNALVPLTQGWLKLPKETTTAFIMGLVRRDFGAAGLYELAMTPKQTMVALLTITMFVPCIASVIVIYKERGWKEASLVWLSTWVIAFLVSGVVAQLII
ncbi:MAG TPA: ferrous iron transport protein B [Clostridia bacterium]|nr:ferrous iron transport protein B [Clostridia bacterium]